MKKVLVTGGAGFIGSHIAEALVSRGFFVRILDNLSSGSRENLSHLPPESFEFIKGDIYDYEIVYEAMRGTSAVFHEAALVSVPASIETPLASVKNNALGTTNILEAARKTGVRKVVFASSAAVYGNPDAERIPETVPVDPLSPYGLDKFYSEKMAQVYSRHYGISAIGLRYFNVYGERQNPSSPYSGVLSIFLDRIKRKETITIYGDGEQTRDFIYVKDVARANLAAMESSLPYGVFNVGTGHSVSLNEVISILKESVDDSVIVEYKASRPGDIHKSRADVSLIKRELDFEAEYSFQDAFLKMI